MLAVKIMLIGALGFTSHGFIKHLRGQLQRRAAPPGWDTLAIIMALAIEGTLEIILMYGFGLMIVNWFL